MCLRKFEANAEDDTPKHAAGHIECAEVSAWLHTDSEEVDFISPYQAVIPAKHLHWRLNVDDVENTFSRRRLDKWRPVYIAAESIEQSKGRRSSQPDPSSTPPYVLEHL